MCILQMHIAPNQINITNINLTTNNWLHLLVGRLSAITDTDLCHKRKHIPKSWVNYILWAKHNVLFISPPNSKGEEQTIENISLANSRHTGIEFGLSRLFVFGGVFSMGFTLKLCTICFFDITMKELRTLWTHSLPAHYYYYLDTLICDSICTSRTCTHRPYTNSNKHISHMCSYKNKTSIMFTSSMVTVQNMSIYF